MTNAMAAVMAKAIVRLRTVISPSFQYGASRFAPIAGKFQRQFCQAAAREREPLDRDLPPDLDDRVGRQFEIIA